MPARRTARILIGLGVAVAVLATLTACSFGKREQRYRDVSEYGGLFHFQVPVEWQSRADSTVIAVYAGERLPSEENAIDSLSVLVFTGPATVDREPTELLTGFIADQEAGRGWEGLVVSEPTSLTVGGRAGIAASLSASSASGSRFRARFTFVRTSGMDVLATAIAPDERFDEFADDLDALFQRWYWHLPPEAAQSTPE